MNSTSISLLDRLQQTDDSKNWNRLVDLYVPLLRAWIRKYNVQPSDDLVQEVLLAVSKDLKNFDHSGHGLTIESIVHAFEHRTCVSNRRPSLSVQVRPPRQCVTLIAGRQCGRYCLVSRIQALFVGHTTISSIPRGEAACDGGTAPAS